MPQAMKANFFVYPHIFSDHLKYFLYTGTVIRSSRLRPFKNILFGLGFTAFVIIGIT